MSARLSSRFWPALLGLSALLAPSALADGGVTFTDVAPDLGISYARVPSVTDASREADKLKPFVTLLDFVFEGNVSRGKPGVVIFDYDGDGDQDIYVTNGPGAPNSLFKNLLSETGTLGFVDVAEAAGVAATAQDSFGACAGDTDNDGYPELLVLGRGGPNLFFKNQGDGTFKDITAESGLGGSTSSSTACSFGDVNGDGLLDIVIGNSFDMSTQLACFVVPHALNEPNKLFLNAGGNHFIDASVPSGIASGPDVDPATDPLRDITWAISMVDFDQDGYTDVVWASDQCATPAEDAGGAPGANRGFVRLFHNDGTGKFTDVTLTTKSDHPAGSWMGLAFADLNCDGHLDIFASNQGEYLDTLVPPPILPPAGARATRWFLGRSDGTFEDVGVGALGGTPFAWGNAALDYDNDGDTDLAFFGGLENGFFVDLDNTGVLLRNQGCTANFVWDESAIAMTRREVHGVAVGDLNGDGFPDIVSVANQFVPDGSGIPLLPLAPRGTVFDAVAKWVPIFFPDFSTGSLIFIPTGITLPNGNLAIHLNSGGNGNGWVKVKTMGTVGITGGGSVNRDGVGAVVSFRPQHGPRSISPVVAGSSTGSQDSLVRSFGLGKDEIGTVEVLWPGGVRNRLYDVHRGETIRFPEIPCSFAGGSASFPAYRQCVKASLDELGAAGILDRRQRSRFLASAIRAFLTE